jgi:acyl-CoA reductase-like NAD-dependent aldehyde dehydrogenase
VRSSSARAIRPGRDHDETDANAEEGGHALAPDHVLVSPEAKDELVAHLKEAIHDFYGDDPKQSPDYGRVINKRNFDRLAAFMGSGTIAAGGETDPGELYIAPTVLVDVPVESPIM